MMMLRRVAAGGSRGNATMSAWRVGDAILESARKRNGPFKPGREGEGGVSAVGKDNGDDAVSPTFEEGQRVLDELDLAPSETTAAPPPLLDPQAKTMKPSEIVGELDKHIVGQKLAKRSVSIALRNRWRRLQLNEDMRDEVSPKNILMIGSTGVGKTEIGRRLAKLSQAPFVKVEATKFTEVGFHGRDVDKIIQDLVETSINLTKQIRMNQQRQSVEQLVEDQILDLLTGKQANTTRESFRDLLRKGDLDKHNITIEAPVPGSNPGSGFPFEIQGAIPMNQMFASLVSVKNGMGQKNKEKRKMPIGEARKVLMDAELETRIDSADITRDAISLAEQHGIVFIDEIDKICSNGESRSSADASAEGVQRDLLPLIEGSVVNTKHGNVNTDHILFIASGAFHTAAPSDLLPELQGRLPIRVELESLTEEDLYRILTEPQANLISQQIKLLATEGLDLVFEEDAVREMARIAALVNGTVENIGARRLHTIMERIVEEVSFYAAELVESFEAGKPVPDGMQSTYEITASSEGGSSRTQVRITKSIVAEKIGDLLETSDFDRFIL